MLIKSEQDSLIEGISVNSQSNNKVNLIIIYYQEIKNEHSMQELAQLQYLVTGIPRTVIFTIKYLT